MTEKLNRDEWTTLLTAMGALDEHLPGRVTVTPDHVMAEFGEGESEVDVYATQKVTNVRVGMVQLLVTRDEAVLMLGHYPYPISQWTVLWRGRPPFNEAREG
jgi:hypothetical protein